MEIGAMFGIVASLIHAIAYLDYNREIIAGRLKPNGSTWGIWAFESALSCATYIAVTGDWAKSLLTVVNCLLCIATFLIALRFKRFDSPSPFDLFALVLGLIAVAVWWLYQSASYANIIMLAAMIIGFFPTYRLAWNSPTHERIRPWLIWSFGYVILTTAIYFRWRGQWLDLAYPVNMIACHALVAIIIRCRQNKVSPPI